MQTIKIDTKKLSRYDIYTSDGKIGKIKDYYFDDIAGYIRYLVVNTEKFLFRNLVLVSPLSIKKISEKDEAIYLSLTKEKLENSPSFNSVDTLSRLYEKAYNEYFTWPNYWESMHGPWVVGPFGIAWHQYEDDFSPAADSLQIEELEKCHLRSLSEIGNYSIQGVDKSHFGHIQSLIFDLETFKLDYWVIDTINYFPSKLVLLPYHKVMQYNWKEKIVEVNLSKDEIKNAPAYSVRSHGVADDGEIEQTTKYYGT